MGRKENQTDQVSIIGYRRLDHRGGRSEGACFARVIRAGITIVSEEATTPEEDIITRLPHEKPRLPRLSFEDRPIDEVSFSVLQNHLRVLFHCKKSL